MVFTGKFKAPALVAFVRRLLKQVDGMVYLIVEEHPVHKSRLVKKFATDNTKRLLLTLLPEY